jgi:hypothetical protein
MRNAGGRAHHGWAGNTIIAAVAFAMLLAGPVTAAEAAAPDVDAHVEFVIGSAVEHEPPGIGWDVGRAQGKLVLDIGPFDTAPGSWSVEQVYAGFAPEEIASGAVAVAGQGVETEVAVALTDYDDDFGGGSFKVTNWTIEAQNALAEIGTLDVSAPILIVQEDGTNARFNIPEPGTTVTRSGPWSVSNYAGWLGGHTLKTGRRWARIQLTATVTEGQVIAVVMPMAENRGRARIKLDGVIQGAVDTYTAGPRRHRVVMWQTPPLSAGEHTVSVINLASPGHRRIDVDAFLIAG